MVKAEYNTLGHYWFVDVDGKKWYFNTSKSARSFANRLNKKGV